MRQFAVFTDSGCDLTAQMADDWCVTIIPLTVHLGEQSYGDYKDEREITYKEVYAQLRTDISAGTSAPNIEDYKQIMEPVLRQGRDILALSLSSALSSTYANGFAAVQELKEAYPEREICILDTKCASLGLGLLIHTAVQLADEGKSLSEAAVIIAGKIPKLCHWFTVENLRRLQQGGRVSTASAILGGLLNIKPVLHVDDNGALVPVSKVRGRQASLEMLADRVAENIISPETQTIFISHGDSIEDVRFLQRKINEKITVKDYAVNFVGPVIGAHAGAGVIAVFFYGQNR